MLRPGRRAHTLPAAVLVAAWLPLSLAGPASGQVYDFSEVTALCEGAVDGENVGSPVRGFDLLLMKNGEVVYHRAFGLWSLNRVANADSSTKTLSGALIMSLVDNAPQPLTLDTRLSDYIPAFTGPKAAITIRQAFSHTSGLRSSTAVSSQTQTLRQAANTIAIPALQFDPPGSVFAYGGTSMHATGAVAEIVGQAPWNTLFQQRLAGPLGLTVTRYVLSTPDNPRIAGGAESNATEFGRFMEMLRRGGLAPDGTRLISEVNVDAMFTRQTAVGITIENTPVQTPYTDGADYGVGVWLDERGPGGELLGALAAGARGFASWIDFDDGMVGVFATDVSSSGDLQQLFYLLRTAAENAVRCGYDFNQDENVDLVDVQQMAQVFVGLINPEANWLDGDLNGDENADLTDAQILAAFVVTGQCGA
jgi:CubicO group peptidase (beta-lactamase class C family)